MNTRKRNFFILLISAFFINLAVEFLPEVQIERSTSVFAKTLRNKKKAVSRKGRKTRSSSKRKNKPGVPVVKVIKTDSLTGEWIHRGKRNIVIYKDSTECLRAMTPFSMPPHAGFPYAEVINRYAEKLEGENVTVYSLIAPTQGEFYMPAEISDNLSQKEAIESFSAFLSEKVKPIFVCDTLYNHISEDIYNRTDHHWSPLGAYYAASAVAHRLDVPFQELENFKSDTIRNYVGTMYKFSGDPEILKYPEDFIFYIPDGDYIAEFIDYPVKKGSKFCESEMHEAPVFRKFKDGSTAAYSTYLGGDNHTVRIKNLQSNSGRKILIVKDSYGNALAPNLINSFSEVHVIDFRYFPHNIIKYIKDNNIHDLLFINCIELAFSPSTSKSLEKLLTTAN